MHGTEFIGVWAHAGTQPQQMANNANQIVRTYSITVPLRVDHRPGIHDVDGATPSIKRGGTREAVWSLDPVAPAKRTRVENYARSEMCQGILIGYAQEIGSVVDLTV